MIGSTGIGLALARISLYRLLLNLESTTVNPLKAVVHKATTENAPFQQRSFSKIFSIAAYTLVFRNRTSFWGSSTLVAVNSARHPFSTRDVQRKEGTELRLKECLHEWVLNALPSFQSTRHKSKTQPLTMMQWLSVFPWLDTATPPNNEPDHAQQAHLNTDPKSRC